MVHASSTVRVVEPASCKFKTKTLINSGMSLVFYFEVLCILLRAMHLGVQTHNLHTRRAGGAQAAKTQKVRDVVPEGTSIFVVCLQ